MEHQAVEVSKQSRSKRKSKLQRKRLRDEEMKQKVEKNDDLESSSVSPRLHGNDAGNEDSQGDDSSCEGSELLAAASNWANRTSDDHDAQSEMNAKKRYEIGAPCSFSLHVTQLSFEATEFDIREHFSAKGCFIKSIRMVFDRGLNGRTFRGVAFIDLQDAESYKRALELHKSKLRGRKINVRPTRTKEELSEIVMQSKEKVAEVIRKQKKGNKDDETGTHRTTSAAQKQPASIVASPPNHQEEGPSPKRLKQRSSHGENRKEKTKLTKKERNRRAAIIRQLQQRRG